MTASPGPPPRVRRWLEQGTALLLEQVDRVEEAAAVGRGPAAHVLPGWGVTHLLAHLAYNAEALMRLLTWARTRSETPMYTSTEARAAEIEAGARRSVAVNAEHVRTSAERLDRAMAELPPESWSVLVRTAQGREVPATEVAWMRVREVWVHAVDLSTDASVSFADVPPDLLQALVVDVLATFRRRGQMPGLVVVAQETSQPMSVDDGAGAGAGRTVVTGRLAELAAWLTGRADGAGLRTEDGRPLPDLPSWL